MTPSIEKEEGTCATPGCGKPASLQCPDCVKFKLPRTFFCAQDCFKKSYGAHKAVHKEAQKIAEFRPPAFKYTGSLRPAYVSPMRDVPSSIEQPEYSKTGLPVSEDALFASYKIHINSPEEIAGIREACRIGREVLDIAARHVRVGVTTEEIDRVVHEATIARNAYPSPLNYKFFPKSCCTSVNEVICHGIPDARPLANGDIVNIDISVFHKGFHGDLNETYFVGNVDEDSKRLVKATYDATMEAIKAVKPNAMARDFGEIIQKCVRKLGYGVVRSFCGHGIGRCLHAPPNIHHYARNKAVGVLKPGMVFTIEPMINMGGWEDICWDFDGWTVTTRDGKRSAQFEHTVVVTETGCEILTARNKDSPPLFLESPADVKETKQKEKEKEEKKQKEPTTAATAAPEQKEKETASAAKKKRGNKKKKAKAAQAKKSAGQTDPQPAALTADAKEPAAATE